MRTAPSRGGALALLAVGLVATSGETWPRWTPGLGGRRIPLLATVMPAGIESALLLMAMGVQITEEPTGLEVHGWQIVALRMPTCHRC